MNAADFDYPHDHFQQQLGVAARAYGLARDHFLKCVGHWHDMEGEFRGHFSFTISADKTRVDGHVLGKSITLYVSPRVTENGNYAEIILSLNGVSSGEKNEIASFLVAPSGSVHSDDEETMLSSENSYHSYKLLVAIARRALMTPVKL